MEWRYKHTFHNVHRDAGELGLDDLVEGVSALESQGWELMSIFRAEPDAAETCCVAAFWRQPQMA